MPARRNRIVREGWARRTLIVGGLLAAGVALHAGAADETRAPLPRGADGKPDLSGIWETLSGADYGLEPHGGTSAAPPSAGVIEGGPLPYQPWARARRDANFAMRDSADKTRLDCYTLGVPRSVYFPAPFQILQRERDVTLVGEFGAVRTIHKNGTPHPEGPFGFWLGDSRARWDGDTLVVDVSDFNDATWLDRTGNFHSDALHVVERWTLRDADTLEYRATVEDPKVFTRPWTLSVLLYRHREAGFQLIENYCFTHAYDEFYPFPKTTHDAPQSDSAAEPSRALHGAASPVPR